MNDLAKQTRSQAVGGTGARLDTQQAVGRTTLVEQAYATAAPARQADPAGPAGQTPGQPGPAGTPSAVGQLGAPDARTAARIEAMNRIAAIRASYAARITAAATDPGPTAAGPATASSTAAAATATGPTDAAPAATAGTRGAARDRHAIAPGTRTTSAIEALEIEMDAACTPDLDALMQDDPQNRYQHPDLAVTEQVFAAVRLHSARRGVAQIGHRADAEAESREHGHVPTDAWCGAFAYTQAEQGGGFDPHWSENMQGEGGIRGALAYSGMAHVWIWSGDRWENLRAYHMRRGSRRWYEAVHRAPPARGIQPGDVVLIDNALGTNPDHIATAIAFDGRYLTTVGGNQGDGEAGVSRSRRPFDLLHNPAPNDVRGTDQDGDRTREADPHLGPKHTRVHGVGRWSIVDYERHIYVTSPRMPGAPPTAAQIASVS